MDRIVTWGTVARKINRKRGTYMWPNDRFIKLFDIELPIIQAPMAGSALSDMVVAVSEAGGLGSLACPLLSPEQAQSELEIIRRKT
jgi:nitronate monooxygenase